MVLDVDNPMKNPFFKHCYDSSIWDIIQREEHSLKVKNEAIINKIKIDR